MESRYYVYVYRYPNGVPFYIGEGSGKRAWYHLNEALKSSSVDKKVMKLSIIRKIVASGYDPIIEIIHSNLLESDAFELEEFLITEIGRRDLNTGPLANMTNGGEGSAGYIHSDASKKKISDKLTGTTKPDSMKQQLSDRMKINNPMKSPETIAKRSGENHWNFNNPNPPNMGKTWTDEQRHRQGERFSGENHPGYGVPCSDARRNAIKKRTTGVKKSTTGNMKKPKAKKQCEVCGIWASGGNISRWHNDKCKFKGVFL
jgi:hypothetical protein